MAGSAILWIHGWGASPRVWGDAPGMLPDKTHHFFSYAGLDTVEQMKHDVREALLQRKPGDFVIAWSLGAMLALEAVFAGGCSFSGLIVTSGTLRFVDREKSRGWPERIVTRMQTQLRMEPTETVRRFSKSMLTEDELSRYVRLPAGFGETDFTSVGLDAGLTFLRETDLTPQWERWRAARQIDVGSHKSIEVSRFHSGGSRPELLWMHGDKDPICPAGALPADLSADERCLIRGAGHVPFVTAADTFDQCVVKFIRALEEFSA